jgi:RNase P subunit RPR2
VQLGMHVPNACAHISMVPHIRAIMRLQYVLADCVVNTCKACGHASKVRL